VIIYLRFNGFETFLSSLKTRLQAWGIGRDAGVAGVKSGGVSNKLAEAVNYIFYYTIFNDAQIAARIITNYYLHTTARQI
jgi:hypothetical protein